MELAATGGNAGATATQDEALVKPRSSQVPCV
jgi:hypothetical protein